jgi:sugar/nucleoside kinase (ribokinase family)
MELLAVGSVAFDSVRTPFGHADRVVGGSATYFSLTASYFSDVAVVAVVGEDFQDSHFDLFLQKGIDIRQIQRVPGKSFYWAGEYGDNLNEARTLVTELNVFADFHPEIHADYRRTPVLFLGNIDPVLQNHVLDQMERPRLTGLDTMNYWIQNRPRELGQVLARVDILFVNETEARMLSGEYNLLRALSRIIALGPRTVVVKRGEYGALIYQDGEIFIAPAYPLEEIFDPTGAGDCFAGGFMGYLAGAPQADFAAMRQAVLFGTTMASFNIESFSVERLRTLTFPEIRERCDRFQRMISLA